MMSIRLATRSDPPSPDARARWAGVEAWFAGNGWPTLPTSGEPELWVDPEWWLVADPTGGSIALDTLSQLMDGLPQPSFLAKSRAWWSMSDNSLILNALLDRGLCRVLHGRESFADLIVFIL